MKMEPARTFPDAIVTARCIDCEREFTGPIGVRFIEIPEGPGVEIIVIDEKRSEQHAIARVERELVPTFVDDGSPRPLMGTA